MSTGKRFKAALIGGSGYGGGEIIRRLLIHPEVELVRIASIDYQLNDPSIRMTDEEKEIFWRERVRLMKLLVGLRYAQAQRTGF